MPEGWDFTILVFLILFFLGWFFLGTQWNVRKGDRVLKWLRHGLPLIGERSTMRWLGSSVVELKINQAVKPFRTAETLVAFEPRDVPFIWGFEHLRGRRDTLIFRSQLQTAPTFELEAFDPKGWTRRASENAIKTKNWSPLERSGDARLVAYCSSGSKSQSAQGLIDLAARSGGQLLRLSVRRNIPNLEVHWLLPNLEGQSGRDFFLQIRKIGEDVLKP